jgi:hypothetical protein
MLAETPDENLKISAQGNYTVKGLAHTITLTEEAMDRVLRTRKYSWNPSIIFDLSVA